MLKIQHERQIPVPPERAWNVLRTFGLDYFKGYAHTVSGSGLGAKRSFSLPDGEMIERISMFDDPGMRLDYVIVKSPWPVKDYTATVRVTPDGEGCLVTWSAVFNSDGADPESAGEIVSNTFRMNLRALEKFVSG